MKEAGKSSRTFHEWALQARSWPTWIRYIVTTAIVGGTLLLQSWLTETLSGPESGRFLLFFPVIVACGLMFNRGNGLYATLLAALLSAFFLLPSVGMSTKQSGFELAIFIGAGFLVAFVVEALHVALVKLDAAHATFKAQASQKQLLLDELSHRVRNDFSNAITVLKMQARSGDGAVREALSAAAGRLHVLAGLHSRLTLNGDRVVVDSAEYIGRLCNDLRLSHLAALPVAMETSIESDPIRLEVAVPLGLVINETVVNAVKHAFPDSRPGRIDVSFISEEENYCLFIADNGKGAGPAAETGRGLGRKLTELLVSQLGGKIAVADNSPGVVVTVIIPRQTSRARD